MLKRASTGVTRNDFWTAFLGPPGAHADPKVALGRSTNDSVTKNALRDKDDPNDRKAASLAQCP